MDGELAAFDQEPEDRAGFANDCEQAVHWGEFCDDRDAESVNDVAGSGDDQENAEDLGNKGRAEFQVADKDEVQAKKSKAEQPDCPVGLDRVHGAFRVIEQGVGVGQLAGGHGEQAGEGDTHPGRNRSQPPVDVLEVPPFWPALGGAFLSRMRALNSSGSSVGCWKGTPRTAAGSTRPSSPRLLGAVRRNGMRDS